MPDKRISEYVSRGTLLAADMLELAGEVGGSPTQLENYKATLAALQAFFGTDPTLTRPILGATTWANRPTAANYLGAMIRISDIGPAGVGSVWISDGPRWVPLNGRVTLSMSGAAVVAPLDTNANTLATITVPGGVMGVNGELLVTTRWVMSGSANKLTAITFGGTSMYSRNETTATFLYHLCPIANRNSVSSQAAGSSANNVVYGSTGNAIATGTINTANNADIAIRMTKTTGSDGVTLYSHKVELVTP